MRKYASHRLEQGILAMPRSTSRPAAALWVGLGLALAAAPHARAALPHGQDFASPQAAADALAAAASASDSARLLAIYGAAGKDLVFSGDAVADATMHKTFAAKFAAHHDITPDGNERAVLLVGQDNWPFPIPLVRQGRSWHFDTAAGAQEILNRRIGRDELRAIRICHGFVEAQREFAASSHSPIYAQRIVSRPGLHDGLFWPATAQEKPSPLGPQAAAAAADGYAVGSGAEPYHGYMFRVLTSQGPAAAGGARPYIVGGKMTGGFGLVGFPAKYGDSGIMTFIVNQDGIVFQKDLGPDTKIAALAMSGFDPDRSWIAQ
jgi:hypothetical protein